MGERDAEPVGWRRGVPFENGDADFVDGIATNPRLDAEPAAGNERAQKSRHVCAECPEGRAAIDGKGMP